LEENAPDERVTVFEGAGAFANVIAVSLQLELATPRTWMPRFELLLVYSRRVARVTVPVRF
jgi:hypothetical protein